MSERGCREAARRYRKRQREDVLDRETARDVVHEALASFEERLAACWAIAHEPCSLASRSACHSNSWAETTRTISRMQSQSSSLVT